MEIITIGHDGENAVRQIMQLFFSLSDCVRVESRLDRLTATAKISFLGKEATGEAEASSYEKLYVTNAVKKAVFYAAKKLSDMPTPWGISTGIRPAKTARKMLDACTDEEITAHLTKEYLMAEEKANLALRVAKKEKGILSSMPKNSVSLYVGIPFCPSRCAYCSFISQATEHNGKYVKPYVESLLKEIAYAAKIVKNLNMTLDCVYFGGGTPTAIPVPLLEKLIYTVKESFDFSHVREFTVEAGRPDTFTKELTDMLAFEKVGRISINPQTMHDATLERVGRRHSVKDVYNAFYLARESGIESINADLIAGLPGEDEKTLEETVSKILGLKPDAVTLHTLYMKRASNLISEFEKIRFAKDTSKAVDLGLKMLTEKGLYPYYMYKQRNTLGNLENVGFAKEGHESVYNVYIMEEVQPILALGAGGSTKMVRGDVIERVYNPKDAADYVNRIDEVLKRKDMFFNFYNREDEKNGIDG